MCRRFDYPSFGQVTTTSRYLYPPTRIGILAAMLDDNLCVLVCRQTVLLRTLPLAKHHNVCPSFTHLTFLLVQAISELGVRARRWIIGSISTQREGCFNPRCYHTWTMGGEKRQEMELPHCERNVFLQSMVRLVK